MDDRRFDAFTKAWARGTSRRTLLKGILAGAAGGLTVAIGRDEASAVICRQGGVLCAKDAQCCSGSCVDNHCACLQDQIPCGPHCCAAGQTCASGQCVTITTTTTAAPTTTTSTTPACLPHGMPCTAAGQCCNGSCCSNRCVDESGDLTNCGGCGNLCGGASECAAPVCNSGTCGTTPTNSGNSCQGGAGTCQNGQCVATTTTTSTTTTSTTTSTTTAAPCNLLPGGSACTRNSDCCSNQCLPDAPAGDGVSICCPICSNGCFCRVTSDPFGRAVCATSGGSAQSCTKSSDCDANEFCDLLNNCAALCPSS